MRETHTFLSQNKKFFFAASQRKKICAWTYLESADVVAISEKSPINRAAEQKASQVDLGNAIKRKEFFPKGKSGVGDTSNWSCLERGEGGGGFDFSQFWKSRRGDEMFTGKIGSSAQPLNSPIWKGGGTFENFIPFRVEGGDGERRRLLCVQVGFRKKKK